ncbi:hypothetical protein BGW36DRAFT_279887, partial [Talaromyces proteolyticus]
MALSQGIYRLLPWTSSLGGNKVVAEMLVTPPHRKSPVLESPSLQMLKRKRDDDHEIIAVLDEHPPTKCRLENMNQASTMDVDESNMNWTPSQEGGNETLKPTSAAPDQALSSMAPSVRYGIDGGQESSQSDNRPPKPKMEISALRQSLDAQLSLEVLLKHNELRLIDQEIAKCQVALEQLRRCAEIPYPASVSYGISQSVSSGDGYAVPFSGSGPSPTSPSPWGVVDGPYSRHYAKWLLPDQRFDGGELPNAPLPSYGYMDTRSTRGNVTETGQLAGKSRSQRGSVNTRLQALPSGYPPPKDKAGPMIIKRKSDNQLVKLVCIDCRRFDFSSTQGFINHCRIAHSRTFASHEAAAEACGETVDVDEAGAVVGGPVEPSNTTTPGYVHPLIRTASSIDRTSKHGPPTSSQFENSPTTSKKASPKPRSLTLKKSTVTGPVTPNSSFIASADTPHLSSLLADLGSGLNLGEIVGDAKVKVDMSAYSSEEESDDEADQATAIDEDRPKVIHGGRLPARTTMPQAASQRPTSSKGHEISRTSSKSRGLNVTTPTRIASYVSPYPPASSPVVLQLDGAHSMDGVDMTENLSPHTVESNQAPSLVSDDDDEFEAASDSESLSPSSSEIGHGEEPDDIEVEDDEGTATPTTTDTKADHVVTSLKRGQGKKGDGVLPPAIVSLNSGKERRRVGQTPPANPKK